MYMMIVVGYLEIIKKRKENEYNVQDEFLIILVSYHLFSSTDIVPNGEIR